MLPTVRLSTSYTVVEMAPVGPVVRIWLPSLLYTKLVRAPFGAIVALGLLQQVSLTPPTDHGSYTAKK